MTFKEVFQRYKEGTASLEEIKFVEEELEKFELLEEYTLAQVDDSCPGLQELMTESDENEIRGIKKTVNRKLLKSILISFLAAAVLVLLSGPICSRIFYNPNRGYQETYGETVSFLLMRRYLPSCTLLAIRRIGPRRSPAFRAAIMWRYARAISSTVAKKHFPAESCEGKWRAAKLP